MPANLDSAVAHPDSTAQSQDAESNLDDVQGLIAQIASELEIDAKKALGGESIVGLVNLLPRVTCKRVLYGTEIVTTNSMCS